MDRRIITAQIAANISGVMRGRSVHAVSEAAGLTAPDLTSRLIGDTEFTVDELVQVTLGDQPIKRRCGVKARMPVREMLDHGRA